MDRAAPEIRQLVRIRDESDVVVARRRARELASQQGLAETAIEALATAVTEIARNIVAHAGSGELLFGRVVDAPRRGVIVIARDTGPGIADIDRAMQDGFSTRGGLGFGLPGTRRLVAEFEIESKVGAGTTVTLRQWASAKSKNE